MTVEVKLPKRFAKQSALPFRRAISLRAVLAVCEGDDGTARVTMPRSPPKRPPLAGAAAAAPPCRYYLPRAGEILGTATTGGAMRVCTHCGLSIGDTAAFCTVCGTRAGTEGPTTTPKPLSGPPVACALCGHPGPLGEVESFRLCGRCRDELELLIDRDSRAGVSITRLETDEDVQRSAARTVDGRYSAFLDEDTCDVCAVMDDKTTTDIGEADRWTPNPKCTSPEGCRCLVVYELASLAAAEVRAFLEYAVQNEVRATAQSVSQFQAARHAAENEQARRLYEALEPMHEAYPCEKTDPGKAAALYRESIVRLLDVDEDPLDRGDVRRELLFIVDRLSIVLKKIGLRTEALEEIDSAASLGLLDCQDDGVKGHRDALRKRRDSLRRALAKAAQDDA